MPDLDDPSLTEQVLDADVFMLPAIVDLVMVTSIHTQIAFADNRPGKLPECVLTKVPGRNFGALHRALIGSG